MSDLDKVKRTYACLREEALKRIDEIERALHKDDTDEMDAEDAERAAARFEHAADELSEIAENMGQLIEKWARAEKRGE